MARKTIVPSIGYPGRSGASRWLLLVGACFLSACRTHPTVSTTQPEKSSDAACSAAPPSASVVPVTQAVSATVHERVPNVIQVQAAGDHTFALRSDGTLYGWGENSHGVLGPDRSVKVWAVPEQVKGLPKIQRVASSEWHACAIDEAGSVYCWGRDVGGALGRGHAKDESFVKPGLVAGIVDAKRLSTSSSTGLGSLTCATQGDSRAFCWGVWTNGGFAIPRHIEELGSAVDVATGAMAACATQSNFDFACRGLVSPSAIANMIHFPSGNLLGTLKTKRVVMGPSHTCALSVTGEIHCWQLDADISEAGLPTPHRVGELVEVQELAMGGELACAVEKSNELFCWRLSDPSARRSPSGRFMTKVVSVALGRKHGCALTQKGEVACWGDNSRGQLGIATLAKQSPATNAVCSPAPDADDSPELGCDLEGFWLWSGNPSPPCAGHVPPERVVLKRATPRGRWQAQYISRNRQTSGALTVDGCKLTLDLVTGLNDQASTVCYLRDCDSIVCQNAPATGKRTQKELDGFALARTDVPPLIEYCPRAHEIREF